MHLLLSVLWGFGCVCIFSSPLKSLLFTINIGTPIEDLECFKFKDSSWTTWGARGSVIFGGVSLPTCSLLHNWTDNLCWWRDVCIWIRSLEQWQMIRYDKTRLLNKFSNSTYCSFYVVFFMFVLRHHICMYRSKSHNNKLQHELVSDFIWLLH